MSTPIPEPLRSLSMISTVRSMSQREIAMAEPIFFDIESFADNEYSLRKLTEVQYIRDPRFELLSVAAAADGRVHVWRGDDPAWLVRFQASDQVGRRFVAHNARFDLRVLSQRHGFIPKRLGDTLSVARYFWFGNHDLDGLARRLCGVGKRGGPPLGKHLNDLDKSAWRALAEYNAYDVALCRRLWNRLVPDLPAGELDLIEQTLRLQLTPKAIDQDAARELARRAASGRDQLLQVYPALQDLCNRPKATLKHMQNQFGATIKTTDKKKIGPLADLPSAAAEFLGALWRFKELSKAGRDAETMQSRMGVGDDKILIDLNYCGAHSHRWTSGGGDSGRASFNIQNLSKSAGIRELLIPAPGNVFIIGDLAQIEARITAWLADEQGQLHAFRDRERDVYIDFASQLFGRQLTKADRAERNIGKQAVLGLGFGMGSQLFADRLRALAPESLDLLCQQFHQQDPVEAARRVVDAYRQQYSRIHANAAAAHNTFLYAAGHPIEGTWPIGCWLRVGRDAKAVTIYLPTGGFLSYRDIELHEREGRFGPEQVAKSLERVVSCSMPIENAVQSIARDVFARALLELEQAGFENTFHVHDEVVVEVPLSCAGAGLERFQAILGHDDPRCPGLPIACSAFLSDRYTKDEDYMEEFTARFERDELRLPHDQDAVNTQVRCA